MTTAKSDHAWKKKAARIGRHRVSQHLRAKLDGDRFAGKRWELVDPWSSEKDGKQYWARAKPCDMRK